MVAPTVLIVDDHPGFRASATTLLSAEGWSVVGEAGDGVSALSAVRALRPSLVLLDVQLPDMDGFAVCAELQATCEHPPVVVLTSTREVGAFRRRLAGSAAVGFVAKADLSGRALLELADVA